MEMLTTAGLVRATPIGRWTFYRRDDAAISEALATIGAALVPGQRR